MYGVRWSKVTSKINIETVIIVCTGPSLKGFDFDRLKGKGYIIAVNDAARYVPFADSWFTLDPWGLTTTQIHPHFKGELYAAVPHDYGMLNAASTAHQVIPNRMVNYLHRIPFHTNQSNKSLDFLTWGLNEDPSCINTGNSGFGALNMAYHLKPKRIAFFGLDASKGYFFGENTFTRSLDHLPYIFRSSLPQLANHNIEVINGSPISKIDCFTRYTIDAAIKHLDKNA